VLLHRHVVVYYYSLALLGEIPLSEIQWLHRDRNWTAVAVRGGKDGIHERRDILLGEHKRGRTRDMTHGD